MNTDYTEIYNAQKQTFLSGVTKEIDFRKKQLLKLKNILLTHEDQLCKAVYQDFNKSKYDVITTEIGLLQHDIRDALSHIQSWSKKKRVKTNLLNLPARSYIYPEPYGQSLIIGAWNYPLLLSLAPCIAAIAAGNTVVLKPSEIAQHTSNVLAKLINQHFDKAFFHVIEGDAEIVTSLLEFKWDKIFFTGSTQVGKIVYQAAAKHLTPVTLELGGKSPAFVTKDCNIDIAVNRIVWGKFLNAGQTCIAPDYILVDQAIHDSFLEKLKNRITAINYTVRDGNYTQIINERHLERLSKLIPEEKIFYQETSDIAQRILAPTILHNIAFSDAIMQEEIFGPILPVISYNNLLEVIEKVSLLPKPLSCYIFSNSKTIQNEIISRISFGGGMVNDTVMHITNTYLPFGGVGDSGVGSYHGKSGFDAFTHYKGVVHKATWIDPKLKYKFNTEKNLKLFKKLLRF
ncbi:MAG: aldehyde dehydrogenase family protein [Brumimicrobium sp.]|nr:aldehyde dehydrogenase family protein [Brumimicrobium sp.]